MSDFKPIKIVDIELTCPASDIEGLHGYQAVNGLVRLHGVPVGYVTAPVVGGQCSGAALRSAALEQLWSPILHQLLYNGLADPIGPGGLHIEELLEKEPPACTGVLPSVTVAVCTRDRPADLSVCLASLQALDYPDLDILVVDNAPSSDATAHLVSEQYPNVRYCREPRPGLDWARNRAIVEARGEIIAYTDDDAAVDPGWVRALACVFAEAPDVMAVTGLVVPYELETKAQVVFERYGGFGRGFKRKWYSLDRRSAKLWRFYGAGRYGTGANMAYRRSLFEQIGYFDPALDVGTVTNGGGDLEMFFRVLQEGYTLVYEPRAIVRHRHRREYQQLATQLTNHGVGLYSYLVRSWQVYPSARSALARLGLWWLWWWNVRRLLLSFIRKGTTPRRLILAEFRGSLMGLTRYRKARANAAKIADTHGLPVPSMAQWKQPSGNILEPNRTTAIRIVNLDQPLRGITDITDYGSTRLFLYRDGRPIDQMDVASNGHPISEAQLRDAIVDHMGVRLLSLDDDRSKEALCAAARAAMNQRYLGLVHRAGARKSGRQLSADVSVSIVLATYDRPGDLRNCLQSLVTQQSPRHVEIIVVDNNPGSGITPPVVAEFPNVRLVSEPRTGLAYARNAGVVVSNGQIIVATDDDVTAPPDWLEKMMAPFAQPEVMAVTGNVLPLEMETPAQRLFEAYGGLGRGFESMEVDGNWFERFHRRAVSTWKLGATANAAFRRSVFSDPDIGLFNEVLGPGTPAGGCGEDTYLFYKILKAGHKLVYEPGAYVWHKHRRDMAALRRQIYNYSKGHVAYHLITLLVDHDSRALMRLGIELPRAHLWRIVRRLRGRAEYPISFVLMEIMGNLAGPFALFRSRRRVQRLGRSAPCMPLAQDPESGPGMVWGAWEQQNSEVDAAVCDWKRETQ